MIKVLRIRTIGGDLQVYKAMPKEEIPDYGTNYVPVQTISKGTYPNTFDIRTWKDKEIQVGSPYFHFEYLPLEKIKFQ